MKNRRINRYLRFLSLVLPFALPVTVFIFWLSSQCDGQEQNPLHIVASMNLEGGRTTTFSTILPDGDQAVWECSHGKFIETGDIVASGRNVTWQPSTGLTDSVSIMITTPTVSDTVRFLPVIPDVVPSVTVSAAYHLSLLERARSIQIAPGMYRAVSREDDLSGYDGLVLLIVKTTGQHREAYGMLPGDTLMLALPLGGIIQATGLDNMENAMDNEGNIQIVFEPLENIPESLQTEQDYSSESAQEPAPSGEQPQSNQTD